MAVFSCVLALLFIIKLLFRKNIHLFEFFYSFSGKIFVYLNFSNSYDNLSYKFTIDIVAIDVLFWGVNRLPECPEVIRNEGSEVLRAQLRHRISNVVWGDLRGNQHAIHPSHKVDVYEGLAVNLSVGIQSKLSQKQEVITVRYTKISRKNTGKFIKLKDYIYFFPKTKWN